MAVGRALEEAPGSGIVCNDCSEEYTYKQAGAVQFVPLGPVMKAFSPSGEKAAAVAPVMLKGAEFDAAPDELTTYTWLGVRNVSEKIADPPVADTAGTIAAVGTDPWPALSSDLRPAVRSADVLSAHIGSR